VSPRAGEATSIASVTAIARRCEFTGEVSRDEFIQVMLSVDSAFSIPLKIVNA
jgi:hypothetical protein